MKSFRLSSLVRTAVLASAVALGSTGACAAGVLQTTGWLFGPGNGVASATGLGSPFPATYTGLAGGFKGILSGLGTPFDLNPVELYCVDLAQTININTGAPHYSVQHGTGTGTDFNIVSVASLFASQAAALTRLISYSESNSTFVDSSAESTSLQLAIWNTIYDTGVSESSSDFLGTGSFKDTSTYAAYANTLLTSAASYNGPLLDLYVLKSSGNQDQLFWISNAGRNNVPEPASLALVGLALVGAGLSRRAKA